MFEKFEFLNFTNMPVVSLTKWIRDNSASYPHYEKMSLRHSMEVAKMLKEVYRLGEIRGRALK